MSFPSIRNWKNIAFKGVYTRSQVKKSLHLCLLFNFVTQFQSLSSYWPCCVQHCLWPWIYSPPLLRGWTMQLKRLLLGRTLLRWVNGQLGLRAWKGQCLRPNLGLSGPLYSPLSMPNQLWCSPQSKQRTHDDELIRWPRINSQQQSSDRAQVLASPQTWESWWANIAFHNM